TLVGRRQGQSPFNFESMLARAKSAVFCVGFNLRHVAKSNEIQNELFKRLENPRYSVRLLISDPAKKRTFAAWQLVSETYLADLHESVEAFRSWNEEHKRLKLKGHLGIRKTAFVAHTVMTIDPNSPGGQMVITPVVPKGQLSA